MCKFLVALLVVLIWLNVSTIWSEASTLNRSYKSCSSDYVRDLVGQMTLEEKVGEMLQIDVGMFLIPTLSIQGNASRISQATLVDLIVNKHVGSFLNNQLTLPEWEEMITLIHNISLTSTRLKIPILYGIDSLHGAQFVIGATLFPHNLGAGATYNLDLIEKSASITAKDTRAAGIPWAFSPNVEVLRHPIWSRNYEIFSEESSVASEMSRAYIRGASGKKSSSKLAHDKVITCAKHFIGYSHPFSGKDHTDSRISERALYDDFIPPFRASFQEGVQTVMASMGSIDGVPVTASRRHLHDLLRGQLGFDGLLVSDYEAIQKLHTRYNVAPTMRDAVRMAIDAGIDMAMYATSTDFAEILVDLVRSGEIESSRIDQSVERILALKDHAGLFDNPFPPSSDSDIARSVGSDEDRAVALDMARESITLLKNFNNTLPLLPDAPIRKILVAGFAADSMSVLNGGWTIHWQGATDQEYAKYNYDSPTILQAVRAAAAAASAAAEQEGSIEVNYVRGFEYDRLTEHGANLANDVRQAQESDVVVVVAGELPYAEVTGNIDDLSLPKAQTQFIQAVHSTGKPIVLVLVEGRARVIPWEAENVHAILLAYLPGTEGGRAISEVLFGATNPSGRLPMTYPRHPNDAVVGAERHFSDISSPQWPLGFGLSYTSFHYSDLVVSPQSAKISPAAKAEAEANSTSTHITVSVTVSNTGSRPGKETVMLFAREAYGCASRAIQIPRHRVLKRFAKVAIDEGQSVTVTFTLDPRRDLLMTRESNAQLQSLASTSMCSREAVVTLMIGQLSTSVTILH